MRRRRGWDVSLVEPLVAVGLAVVFGASAIVLGLHSATTWHYSTHNPKRDIGDLVLLTDDPGVPVSLVVVYDLTVVGALDPMLYPQSGVTVFVQTDSLRPVGWHLYMLVTDHHEGVPAASISGMRLVNRFGTGLLLYEQSGVAMPREPGEPSLLDRFDSGSGLRGPVPSVSVVDINYYYLELPKGNAAHIDFALPSMNRNADTLVAIRDSPGTGESAGTYVKGSAPVSLNWRVEVRPYGDFVSGLGSANLVQDGTAGRWYWRGVGESSAITALGTNPGYQSAVARRQLWVGLLLGITGSAAVAGIGPLVRRVIAAKTTARSGGR